MLYPKYSASIDNIAALNDKFDLFINGNDDDYIVNEKGVVIKSLAGIQKELKSFKYVQKIIDFDTYANMLIADSLIEIGILCRVWGDSNITLNGIYRKSGNAAYVKISYADIYDLGNMLPNPWNYISISKSPIEFNRDIKLFKTSLPNMIGKTFMRVIEGDLTALTETQNYRGTYSTKFKIHLAVGGSIAKSIVSIHDRVVVGIDSDIVLDLNDGTQLSIDSDTVLLLDGSFSQYTLPIITVTKVTTSLSHDFTISISSFKSGNYIIPGQLDMTIKSLDSKLIRVVNNDIVSNTILPANPVLP